MLLAPLRTTSISNVSSCLHPPPLCYHRMYHCWWTGSTYPLAALHETRSQPRWEHYLLLLNLLLDLCKDASSAVPPTSPQLNLPIDSRYLIITIMYHHNPTNEIIGNPRNAASSIAFESFYISPETVQATPIKAIGRYSRKSSLITHHSSLITHHSSLITHHSPLTTHHSPLPTPHLPFTPSDYFTRWTAETIHVPPQSLVRGSYPFSFSSFPLFFFFSLFI